MSANKLEPAFPTHRWDNYDCEVYTHGGMTLRDYFAAKAMQGICAHPDNWGCRTESIGAQAYAIADFMLKAREQ